MLWSLLLDSTGVRTDNKHWYDIDYYQTKNYNPLCVQIYNILHILIWKIIKID